MITRIREVRRAKGLTLQEVAERCVPPTTSQTIGRLETGTRTVSLAWLRRIAAALGSDPGDLVQLEEEATLPVAAIIGPDGVQAPRRSAVSTPPRPLPGMVSVQVQSGVGDYRAGDELWCERLEPAEFGRAINRDVLVPRPAGRFLFGRLLAREDGRLHLLPLGTGQRQRVVDNPPWLAAAVRLVRTL